jgi:hypothetical protein
MAPIGDVPDWQQTVAVDVILASQTNIPLSDTGALVYLGDVMDYNTLLLCSANPTVDYRVDINWFTSTDATQATSSDTWHAPAYFQFRTWAPVAGHSAAIWLAGKGGTKLSDFTVYGVRSPAPDHILVGPPILLGAMGRNIAAGVAVDTVLPPYRGPCHLYVVQGSAATYRWAVHALDAYGTEVADIAAGDVSSTLRYNTDFSLSSYINHFILTNTDTASHTYTYALTPE